MNPLARLQELAIQWPALACYALVDGLQYQKRHGVPLKRNATCVALFDGTADQALSEAGPWLCAVRNPSPLTTSLVVDQHHMPIVSWLFSERPFTALAHSLRQRLEVRLPDQKQALLRFYDPRVLKALFATLRSDQRRAFLHDVHEWMFIVDEQMVRIEASDA